jgi:hypothetical protein
VRERRFVSAPEGSRVQDAGVDEPGLEVVEVLRQGRLLEELVHDGKEVLKASDGFQGVLV